MQEENLVDLLNRKLPPGKRTSTWQEEGDNVVIMVETGLGLPVRHVRRYLDEQDFWDHLETLFGEDNFASLFAQATTTEFGKLRRQYKWKKDTLQSRLKQPASGGYLGFNSRLQRIEHTLAHIESYLSAHSRQA